MPSFIDIDFKALVVVTKYSNASKIKNNIIFYYNFII